MPELQTVNDLCSFTLAAKPPYNYSFLETGGRDLIEVRDNSKDFADSLEKSCSALWGVFFSGGVTVFVCVPAKTKPPGGG